MIAAPPGHDAHAGVQRIVFFLVAVLLGTFVVLAVTSVLEKSNTYDEIVHLTAGVSYWRFNDYRIDPENGNLPQRWMALPLLVGGYRFPSLNRPKWDQWMLAVDFFFRSGNDTPRMILSARVMIALLAVGLGGLVYAWSSRLYGRGGGLVSMVLYGFSTTILAHGRLATSDLTATLFFLASVGCLWRMLHRFTLWNVLGSAVVMGLLFVSKMSAVLIVPMGLVLILLRLLGGRPLAVKLGKVRQVSGWLGQVGLFVGAIVVHAAVVVGTIWAFYGFRYSAIHPGLLGREQMEAHWQKELEKPFPMQGAVVFAREHRLLPESYLIGQAHVLKHSQIRLAFLNGKYSVRGWWWFFPYCLLVKTPLSLFAILALAAVAAGVGWRKKVATGDSPWRAAAAPGGSMGSAAWDAFYRTAPLWVLLVVYWSTAIASKINIGHRHVLPTYPVMFILAGGAVSLMGRGRRAVLGWVVGLLLVAYAAEGVWTWPNYLAYFNQGVGGPRNGYRHLVDSSLDWGQDLPGLKRWLEHHGLADPQDTPVYLSYFGTASPAYYGIKAWRLPFFFEADVNEPAAGPLLAGGVYCISATMLQTVLTYPPGPWTDSQEQTYRAVLAHVVKLIQSGPEGIQAALQGPQRDFWARVMDEFEQLRFKRLMSFLRHRQPDDQVGYSILIYHLSDGEARSAMFAPPVEIEPEDPSLFTEP